MSMAQEGHPDPQTPGPVSGNPQYSYDPQSQSQQAPIQPPPHAPPPHSPAGPAPVARPAVLMIGAIGTGVLALLFLVRGILAILGVEDTYDIMSTVSNTLYGVYYLGIALGAAAAAVLAMMGTDFGRIFAAAVGGAAMWEAAAWWRSLIAPTLDGEGVKVDHFPWIPGVVAILGGFVGIAIIIVMSMPTISVYSAEKRKKPVAAAPMGGPPPHPGQTYGGQQQSGLPYGDQYPAGPEQSGSPYGGPPQSGSPYGEPPSAGPEQQGSPYGAPPPAGPQA